MKSQKASLKEKAESNGLSLDESKQKQFLQKLKTIDSDEVLKAGTVYIGHLPRGFYEDQIKEYFTQFGTVNKVRLARSKKTGGYKGYGFVQFASEDVARIAAEAMHNYLMFDRLIQCEYVTDDKLHPAVWKGANKKFVWCDRRKRHALQHNKKKDIAAQQKQIKRSLKKDRKRKSKLLEMGLNYEFPKLASKLKKKKIKVKTTTTPSSGKSKTKRTKKSKTVSSKTME